MAWQSSIPGDIGHQSLGTLVIDPWGHWPTLTRAMFVFRTWLCPGRGDCERKCWKVFPVRKHPIAYWTHPTGRNMVLFHRHSLSGGAGRPLPRRQTHGTPGKLPCLHDPTAPRVWGLPPPPAAPVPHLLHAPAAVSGWIRAQLNLGGSISTPASASQGKGRSKGGRERRATGGSTPWPLDGLVEPRILSGCEAMEEPREAGIFLGDPTGLSGCHLDQGL